MEAKTYFDSEKKVWKGEDSLPLYNPQASLGEVLLKAFTIFGSNVAQVRTLSINLLIKLAFTEEN